MPSSSFFLFFSFCLSILKTCMGQLSISTVSTRFKQVPRCPQFPCHEWLVKGPVGSWAWDAETGKYSLAAARISVAMGSCVLTLTPLGNLYKSICGNLVSWDLSFGWFGKTGGSLSYGGRYRVSLYCWRRFLFSLDIYKLFMIRFACPRSVYKSAFTVTVDARYKYSCGTSQVRRSYTKKGENKGFGTVLHLVLLNVDVLGG